MIHDFGVSPASYYRPCYLHMPVRQAPTGRDYRDSLYILNGYNLETKSER